MTYIYTHNVYTHVHTTHTHRGERRGHTDAPRVMAGSSGTQGPGVERDNNMSRHIPAGEPKDPGGVTVRASEEGKVSSPPRMGKKVATHTDSSFQPIPKRAPLCRLSNERFS